MDKLYHITRSRNVSNIKLYGLIPGSARGFGRNTMTGFSKDPVPLWLTDSPLWIVQNQIGNHYRYSLSLLTISISGLDVLSATNYYGISRHEYVCFRTIEPSRIIDCHNLVRDYVTAW